MMDKQQLDAIRKMCEAATPGPWNYDGMHNEIHCLAPGEEYFLIMSELRVHPNEGIPDRFGHKHNPNFELIAACRTDLPALLAEVERLMKERDVVISDVKILGYTVGLPCLGCEDNSNGLPGNTAICRACNGSSERIHWKWRGTQEG